MKYKDDYFFTTTREEFIKLLYKKYKLKKQSAYRTYYKIKKVYGRQNPKFNLQEKRKPNYMKMLQLKDMKDKNFKITKTLLSKYGYSTFEINWLDDEGWIEAV